MFGSKKVAAISPYDLKSNWLSSANFSCKKRCEKKSSYIFRSEYGAFWKCVTAGAIYMITQLAKMIFLATVFPVPLDEDDDDPNAEIPFDFLMVSHFRPGTAGNT